ncbi:flagellin Hag [Microbacterium oryzae]|uniref:Flagellin n=1 Tax=Microbacterium oryzae TaxID=743009 RepID=A0A6I6E410_9MICO|nr:flagellin [Microbacterium oryzae]QGU26541.1 flagellin [Microbacterium oryzae]
MGLQIATNVGALNAYRNLSSNQNDVSKSLEKLSSGLRINRAADDAAGLAISEGLRSQVNGLNVAARNAQDGISVIQTAEGALTEVHSILQRMRDLAVQGANDSNNADSRKAIQTELDSLGSELGRIKDSTNFNGIKLLDAATDAPTTLNFQVGADGDAASKIAVTLGGLEKALTGLSYTGSDGSEATDGAVVTFPADGAAVTASALSVETTAEAQNSVEILDTAIKNISEQRAGLGASQNRLESAINSLNVSAENLSAAKSRIADTDMASEMVKYTASNILAQAGQAMLAQANQSGQGVLQLLR